MTPFYEACITACEELYALFNLPEIKSLYHKTGKIGAGGDEITGIDLAAEKILVRHLSPFGQIISEESGVIGEEEGRKIIIDPLDGSSNALSRFPYYGVSIAHTDAEGVLHDAFVCNLANGDLFFLNQNGSVRQTRIGEDEIFDPYTAPEPEIGIFEKAYAHSEIVEALHKKGYKFRTPGAVALSLAYSRNAKFFLFVGEYRDYDFKAGLALCQNMTIIIGRGFIVVSKYSDVARDIADLVKDILSREG
jgi:myo-inositol-1(or 4)-monophosphatase